MAVNDELMHYGVKGMKWGVRKDRGSSGGGLRGKKKKSEPEYKKMSDAELKKKVARLQLEAQYKNLTKTDQTRWQKAGERFIDQAIIGAGIGFAASKSQRMLNKIGSKTVDPVIDRYTEKLIRILAKTGRSIRRRLP